MLTCRLTGTTELPGSAAANTSTLYPSPAQPQEANGPKSSATTVRRKRRRTADLHKWEFLHLMQLPWVNW